MLRRREFCRSVFALAASTAWKMLPADSTLDEVIRNFFIRQPVLWA